MLGWIFDTLSRRTTIWVNDWHSTSVTRKNLSYPIVERVLRWSSENHLLFLSVVWLSVLFLSAVAGLVIPTYFGICLVPSQWNEAELIAYFGTLWTIQATLAALVYPIVIAFVAVLLQRRATAKLSMRLYALDAAVAPAGSSAIALLTWMGLQYVFISFVPTVWFAAAMVGNSAWFVLNSVLTGWFLYRTVQFLDDTNRLEVFKRFGVQVAFLREVREHISGLIFSNAIDHKIIPGSSYVSNDPMPKVLLFPMSLGEPCITIFHSKEQAVKDIRLRFLRWGVMLWLRSASRARGGGAIAGLEPQSPLLVIPIAIGDEVDGNVVLCRVQHGPETGWLATILIKNCVVFGPSLSSSASYSTIEILEELSMEAIELAERNRYEAASEAVNGLMELHAELIRSGAFVNDSGAPDNAVMLTDPYGFGSQKIHERWLRVYRPLAEIAVQKLHTDSTLWRRHCNLANRLVHSLQDENLEILMYTFHISTNLMYRLGIWWVEKVDERGSIEHDASHATVLPAPLSGTYERALNTFIGGWEEISLSQPTIKPVTADDTWRMYSRQARFAAKKAEETAHMLLAAVYRGDKAAALWLADSFLKWWDKLEYRFDGHGASEIGHSLLTFSCIEKSWSEIRMLLDAVPDGPQEITFTAEISATVLRRYWTDLRILIICILLDWTSHKTSSDAFALELAIALLQGKSLKHGGQVDADALTNPPFVLFRLIRLQLVDRQYEKMLDKVVERAQELLSPDMVSGRMYSSSGADDVGSLCVAQVQILTAITTAPIQPFPPMTSMAQTWSKDLQQLKNLNHLSNQLAKSIDGEAFKEKIALTATTRKAIGLPDNVEEASGFAKQALSDLVALADAIHDQTLIEATVSQSKLDELGAQISEYLLGPENNVFPFSLRPKVQGDVYSGEPKSLSFSGLSKAAYTDPPLRSEPSMATHLGGYVASAIGRELIADYITSSKLSPIRNDSELAFFEDMVTRAKALVDQGYSPLLLVPTQRAPEWLSPWRLHGDAEPLPNNIRMRLRKAEDEPGLFAYFEDIPAYRVQLNDAHCYLVAREDFINVTFETKTVGPCVSVSHAPEENNSIRIMFEWSFGLSRTPSYNV